MYVFGIIPARGGSKGVPGKNIRFLCGKPLIAYTIQDANKSRLLDRTIVSTDDTQIADVTREFGGDVPFMRPAELATDESPALLTYQHAVRWLEKHEGIRPDVVVVLQPTSPLGRPEHIDQAIDMLSITGADTVLSLCEASYTPYNMKRIVEGCVLPLMDNRPISRRQDAPIVYQPNGVLCVTRYEVLMEQDRLLGNDTRPFVMDFEFSVNIDTEWDFEMAELIMQGKDVEDDRKNEFS